ncbi:MAG: ammonia-forming cytochrome c nitrite reductase subunit c552 [Campylobacter sp.]|nr:ammonia-forming cytochrome c nitrite reductase subunit c552 [Campylobacter sp.]
MHYICADCHMPYMAEGGVKFTHHNITSPLKNMVKLATKHLNLKPQMRCLNALIYQTVMSISDKNASG